MEPPNNEQLVWFGPPSSGGHRAFFFFPFFPLLLVVVAFCFRFSSLVVVCVCCLAIAKAPSRSCRHGDGGHAPPAAAPPVLLPLLDLARLLPLPHRRLSRWARHVWPYQSPRRQVGALRSWIFISSPTFSNQNWCPAPFRLRSSELRPHSSHVAIDCFCHFSWESHHYCNASLSLVWIPLWRVVLGYQFCSSVPPGEPPP